ncbi:hypothetical protein A4U53_031050 [Rhizobium ruizarguesonis]|uniref:Uncharacterized protein n=1 Tax=Rhizobium ruizarguesonis TaxID=2081791 RepID=A0ACD5EMK3_9HYPH|nr:hypothetical protein [Rhizobium leguminosarum]
MTNIKIETADDGITISQACPSPEWSITGKGGRTDTVFIAKDDAQAVIEALRAIGDAE